MNKKYKTQGKIGLFDNQFAKHLLKDMGNPLEVISKVVDFEIFRTLLEAKLLNTNKKNNAGAKPFDVVFMFKILFIQWYYNLSDNQVEMQSICDVFGLMEQSMRGLFIRSIGLVRATAIVGLINLTYNIFRYEQ